MQEIEILFDKLKYQILSDKRFTVKKDFSLYVLMEEISKKIKNNLTK